MGSKRVVHNFTSYLGHGSFGIVLKSINEDQFFSATKIIFPSPAKQQVFRETSLMKGKSHPNVVQIEEAQLQNFSLAELDNILKPVPENIQDLPFILTVVNKARKRNTFIATICVKMELCGQTLREWLNLHSSQELTPEMQNFQMKIISQIMAGIGFMHDNKIIHRDLKPENIMFSSTTEEFSFFLPVKVGDFGLCRVLHNEESRTDTPTSKVGTFIYRAPEMESHMYDHRSDIYTLGLIICEILHLKPIGKERSNFIYNIKQGNFNQVLEHPLIKDTGEFISVATRREVDHRIGSVHDLEKIFLDKLRDSGLEPSVSYFDVRAMYLRDIWIRNFFKRDHETQSTDARNLFKSVESIASNVQNRIPHAAIAFNWGDVTVYILDENDSIIPIYGPNRNTICFPNGESLINIGGQGSISEGNHDVEPLAQYFLGPGGVANDLLDVNPETLLALIFATLDTICKHKMGTDAEIQYSIIFQNFRCSHFHKVLKNAVRISNIRANLYDQTIGFLCPKFKFQIPSKTRVLISSEYTCMLYNTNMSNSVEFVEHEGKFICAQISMGYGSGESSSPTPLRSLEFNTSLDHKNKLTIFLLCPEHLRRRRESFLKDYYFEISDNTEIQYCTLNDALATVLLHGITHNSIRAEFRNIFEISPLNINGEELVCSKHQHSEWKLLDENDIVEEIQYLRVALHGTQICIDGESSEKRIPVKFS
ncbi:Interferon-induced, double-stranded RNA-activated protein kinase [Folsomia candida]|uniref:non-specific serine/threonine protein kinase n=1 Tax=Folsomia candida TaxID=158441 RepID=A0A226DXH5_FOLCA|nr:Interferon-induced, double-stranded RNA-activated protein kinase [Folsomia candida]